MRQIDMAREADRECAEDSLSCDAQFVCERDRERERERDLSLYVCVREIAYDQCVMVCETKQGYVVGVCGKEDKAGLCCWCVW